MEYSTRNLLVCLPVLVLGFITGAHAANEPLPPAVDVLTNFYEKMDGDNWRNNDGWLDPDVDLCDWHGVSCGFDDISLYLPSNNLSGNLNETDILRLVRKINLSDNQIRGTLPFLGSRLETVDLSHNLLDGELPGISGRAGQNLIELDLANNEFSGEVPESWEQLDLIELDLSNNELTGTAEGAFAATRNDWSILFLADNQFAGELPPSLTERKIFINLCWTGFEFNDPNLAEWIAENHAGRPDFDIESCTNRERLPVNLALSGSWFNPDRDGEGLSLMMLDNGAPLVYWFTHINKGRQMWLFKMGETDGPTLFFPRWLRTNGSFGEGFGDHAFSGAAKGTLRLNHVRGDILHGQYVVNYTNKELEQGEGPVFPEVVPMTHWFFWDHVRLTRLAGTTCDNQRDNQWISGAWYDPERDGEGFVVEVTGDGRGVVYWFTFTPDGEEQAWMVGEGTFAGNTLHIENLVQPRDTGAGMPFDASGIENKDWGTLTMEFHDDEAGHVTFDSELEAYGSGDFAIERLARPKLAECAAEE